MRVDRLETAWWMTGRLRELGFEKFIEVVGVYGIPVLYGLVTLSGVSEENIQGAVTALLNPPPAPSDP